MHVKKDKNKAKETASFIVAHSGPFVTSVAATPKELNQSTSRLWLNLPRFPFIVTWFTIVMLHVLCGITLILTGRIYVFFINPNMIYWTKLLGGGTDNPYFLISSISLTIVGALHLQQVLWILLDSVRERELVFRRKIQRTTLSRMKSIRNRLQTAIESNQGNIMKTLTHAAQVLTVLGLKVVGREGFLRVESKFFPFVFAIREIVEVSSQTYQAYRSCNLIPRPWINHIIMTLLITNCWSTPISQYLVRNHPAIERIVCLMIDALLNIGSSFIIPAMVFLPYYQVFDFAIYSFPYIYTYDTLWYARLVMENRMLFALSFSDLLSKMINQLSIFSSIVSATTLIRRRYVRVETAHIMKVSAINVKTASNSLISVSKGRACCFHHFVHAVFYAWGVVLLVIYARAVHHGSGSMVGCLNSMSPWFSTNFPCSVFIFNCDRHQVESPSGKELQQLDNDTLASLVFSHCPAIEVPREIQNFPNLLGFQLHNCSIRSWPRESAISAEKHGSLVAVGLTRTNMSEFPEGLMGPLPATLNDVEFSITNLSKLPDDLGQRWHALSILYIEKSQVREVPASLFQIPVIVLSLMGNQIEYLPPLDDVHAFYYIADLSKNPLQALPATIGLGSYVVYLNVEESNVTSLPSWVSTNVALPFGQGSPYCLNLTSESPYTVGVGCMVPDPRGGGRVPMAVIDSKLTL